MSEENVEIVRRVYEAAARRDAATILQLYDPDVEIDVSRTHRAVMENVYSGPDHQGLRKWSREWHEAWESVEYGIEELIDAGDSVIGVITVRGRGKTSGVAGEMARHAGVWTVRRGKVIRVVWCQTRDEALEVIGLSE